MLQFRYKKTSVLRRIVAIQLIPMIIALHVILAYVGWERISPLEIFGFAATGLMLLYFMMMKLLVGFILDPIIMSVSSDGTLTWKPLFKRQHFAVPAGTVVQVSTREVAVRPPLKNIPTTLERNGSTIFRLPRGLEPYEKGEVAF